MTTVTITNPFKKSATSRSFNYSHTARTWLLLSGFLPTSPNQYQNTFTGETAVIYTRSKQHV